MRLDDSVGLRDGFARQRVGRYLRIHLRDPTRQFLMSHGDHFPRAQASAAAPRPPQIVPVAKA